MNKDVYSAIHKYADGVVLSGGSTGDLCRGMDETLKKLDPDWESNLGRRWNLRPADVLEGGGG